MTEQQLEEYFTGIATDLKDIGHTPDAPAFYRIKDAMDLDEFDDAVRNMTAGVCLLLETGESNIGSYDSQTDRLRIGLHVLKHTTEDFDDINAARDFAKAALLKIVSRIRLDCKGKFERTNGQDGPLRQLATVFSTDGKLSNMTAIDGNWYGKSMYFDFAVPLDITYNTEDWNA
ncbi:MAG TPA: hypothetical protein VHA56_16095 [Mucilaginibacter sp.]|nr:hypothetical protein [Mucilaginibacter sp.]